MLTPSSMHCRSTNPFYIVSLSSSSVWAFPLSSLHHLSEETRLSSTNGDDLHRREEEMSKQQWSTSISTDCHLIPSLVIVGLIAIWSPIAKSPILMGLGWITDGFVWIAYEFNCGWNFVWLIVGFVGWNRVRVCYRLIVGWNRFVVGWLYKVWLWIWWWNREREFCCDLF